MNDVRLIDDPNDDLGSLLRAAREETGVSPADQKELVWKSLASTGVAASAAVGVKTST